MKKRPNIVLIMTDQHRGDCLGAENHPDVCTPNLDALAARGVRFTRAYTPSPICCAARHSVLTGCSPATNGVLDNSPARIACPERTLPELFRRAGYQTAEIGRTMHQYPGYARYGFEVRRNSIFDSFYSVAHERMRRQEGPEAFENWPHLLEHGQSIDSYGARPWPYDEELHQSNHATHTAMDFLQRRDRDVPYFMYVGYVAPHPPLVPPAPYYDRYVRRQLQPPVVGDWVTATPVAGRDAINSGLRPASDFLMHETMAGYYGLIDHMDSMLHNLLYRIYLEGGPTYIIFTSDHGEMLGDHHMFRKLRPYEGSARVPMIVAGPGIPQGKVVDEAVSLIDLLPTCCALAELGVPPEVEGRSLTALWSDSPRDWRPFIHSEHSAIVDHKGFHMLTDGREKYIWWSGDGREQLFNLENDPRERHDLAPAGTHPSLPTWRERLTNYLKDRPEGFVKDGKLTPGANHTGLLPWAVPV